MKNGFLLSVLTLFFCANLAFAQQPSIQYFRPWDQEGINQFEPSKKAEQPEYTGFKMRIGGAFTQTFQSITHENSPNTISPTNKNLLYGVVRAEDTTSATLTGFNLAMANLNFDFQIADGIRVGLENYMSSRHHSEFWVKGGYIQIDKLPMFGNPKWFNDYLRVKIGHFQPNYGDMQFRRQDGGNAMFNPFVENYILDAFTTEIGGEVYLFPAEGFMAMVGMNSGFINGNVENYPEANNTFGVVPTKKSPSITAKLAYDNTFDDLRIRLSASFYNNSNSARNTLYAGDRTGSQYFLAMEPAVQANGSNTSPSAQFASGRFNPNLANRVQSIMINPFVKYKGLEIFGAYEIVNGSVYGDTLNAPRPTWEKRNFNQISIEGVYRFLSREQVFVGVRYNTMTGEPQGLKYVDLPLLPSGSQSPLDDNKTGQAEVSIDRLAIAAGWFPTKNLLLKGEYVIQNFKDFPKADYRDAGKFREFMIQAVVGF